MQESRYDSVHGYVTCTSPHYVSIDRRKASSSVSIRGWACGVREVTYESFEHR